METKIVKKLTIDASVVQDNIPCEVIPKLFIGSIYSALNEEILLANKVTHILNASRFPSTFPKLFTYLSVDIRDKDDANILSCIPTANIFIEAGLIKSLIYFYLHGRSR